MTSLDNSRRVCDVSHCYNLAAVLHPDSGLALCSGCASTVRQRQQPDEPSVYTDTYTPPRGFKAPEYECVAEDCLAPARTQDGTTVLCEECYISGGGPRHDAYADWVRSLGGAVVSSVSRTAFAAGWDARDPARCKVCRSLGGGGCAACTPCDAKGQWCSVHDRDHAFVEEPPPKPVQLCDEDGCEDPIRCYDARGQWCGAHVNAHLRPEPPQPRPPHTPSWTGLL